MVTQHDSEGKPEDMPIEEWLWITNQKSPKGNEEDL